MLQTIVVEIEATLNERPLTYVSSEFELEDVVTPAQRRPSKLQTYLSHLYFM
ncbi:hypothetical protein DPMN_174759 [Dreissena polymorpha]|uniref:Uncharacterized protein n=1 Tax=Dreissena polymorpha TaxID=45954 RepID=A0A9D4E6X7_DREPO|nr:hypothetical protein DPMN_174759 [Dreissena polymorpha]